MLAQIKLALVLLDLDFCLTLHVFGDAGASDFPLDPSEQEFQTLTDVQSLKNLVLVGDLEIEIGGGEIGEPARIRDVHLQNRRHFIGDALDQLGKGFRAGDDARDEIIDLVRIGRNLFRRFDAYDREGIGLNHALDDQPAQAL